MHLEGALKILVNNVSYCHISDSQIPEQKMYCYF